MVVCVCKVINEAAIDLAIRNGCNSETELKNMLGICTECGICEDTVSEILDSHRKNNFAADKTATMPA